MQIKKTLSYFNFYETVSTYLWVNIFIVTSLLSIIDLLNSDVGAWWYLNVKGFTNDTTFHGIRYVFADTLFQIRR